ncbi:MAG TPA: winged helix-turn-helix domain-containing protein [Streptosporangiaceae bacterium]|jgi:restriction system protein
MAVPDYQSLMAPALHVLADGQDHSMPELRTVITERVALTPGDLVATIRSGASLFSSRLHWAITYMYQSGLVRRPRRGVVQITPRGQEVLAKHPDRVDLSIRRCGGPESRVP